MGYGKKDYGRKAVDYGRKTAGLRKDGGWITLGWPMDYGRKVGAVTVGWGMD